MLTPATFQQLLLQWFATHGRKSLPWQQNKTAYRVWISEIMLQQTQVSTVISYYEKFMRTFPDIKTLANANEDLVFQHWAGLGYYSRARHLHAAAKKIHHELNGEFPDDFATMLQLPGIGASTAGAILSIAFQKAVPILDGNVKRVFARLLAIQEPIDSSVGTNILWQIAKEFMPHTRAADYTQAIMDFGATCCTRSKPNCAACPMSALCLAYQKNWVDILPAKKNQRKIPTKEATFVILKTKNAIYLEKRPAKGIWSGLWSLPELKGKADKKNLQDFCRTRFKLKINDFQTLASFRHTFTHYHLTIHPVIISLPRQREMATKRGIWYTQKHFDKYGLPKPVLTLMRNLL